MKYRSLWQGTLGASLTICLTACVALPAVAETVPNEALSTAPATLSTSATPVSADATAPSAVESDTDAPAKLVSNQKSLPASIRPSSPASEVIKLANSGLDESVMLAFVTNSTSLFNLGAEEIIYLNDIGVPGAVVTAMIQRDQEVKTSLAAAVNRPAPSAEPPIAPDDNSQVAAGNPAAEQPMEPNPAYPVEAPLTPPDDGTDAMFYDSLSPYGNWVDIGGYGVCWQPTAGLANPGWQPYFDCGHWVYSDCGWYWASDYSWGWAPFHYGAWFRHGRLGWCWAPGRVWGPSWVSWRYDHDHCGWAPLPPGASFSAGVGLTYHGRHVWDGDDLGVRPDHYHFVAWNHFNDRELRPHRLPPDEAARAYANSNVGTRISGDGHTVINNGLPPSQVVAATHRPIHTVALREVNEPVSSGGRVEGYEANGRTLAVYRPNPALAARLPSRAPAAGVMGAAPWAPSVRTVPTATPAAPRSSSPARRSSNALDQSSPLARQSAPLILRGAQASGLRESAPANSLVVVGGRAPQSATTAPPWNPNSVVARQQVNRVENNTATGVPGAESAPAATQSPAARMPVMASPQRNWMGTVTSSRQPWWFGADGAAASRPVENRAPVPEARSYQPITRSEVPRYTPAPSYTPQRSYSAPAWSAPARTPSFETRSAPSAPSAPAAASHASSSQSQSSGRGR